MKRMSIISDCKSWFGFVLVILLASCGRQAEKQDQNGGFNSVLFDVNSTSIPGGSSDTVETIRKNFASIDIAGSGAFWPGKKSFYMHAMGSVSFPETATYTFRLTCAGKIVLRVNNIDAFIIGDVKDTVMVNSQFLPKGKNTVEFEYYDGGLDPMIKLEWSTDGKNFEVIPASAYSTMSREVLRQDSLNALNPKTFVRTKLNALTEQEKKDGWKLLFDGRTTAGWHRYNSPGVIGSKWVVEDSVLTFKGRNRFRYELENCVIEIGHTDKLGDGGMDIVTDESFGDFELTLDWKISKGGNSGIFYTVLEDPKYTEAWKTSPEMQVLDNLGNKEGFIPRHRAGDLYDLIACGEVTANPYGYWNEVRILKKNGLIEHWLNGVKVLQYDLNSPEWKEMISKSKFATLTDYATAKKGQIALQDHDNAVSFRNIKIRELK